MQCKRPGCTSQNAIQRPSMTCYVNMDGVPTDDPTDELNPKPVLCDEHAEEYEDYWNDMWAEYRSSQGV